MRFKFDRKKSEKLRKDPRQKIGFDEVQEIWNHYHYVDCRSDDPEQFRVIGWVQGNAKARNILIFLRFRVLPDGRLNT